VVVPASDPKDLFMERGACNHVNRVKHRADMGRLSQVACYFSSFTDVWGRRKGWCNPNLGTKGGFCRM
jgi:hypothetical protein